MTTSIIPAATVSPLRRRLIADMALRRFSAETQRHYLRDVGRLASFLGRSPDTASVEDLRRFQIALQEAGLGVPTMNEIVSARRAGDAKFGSDLTEWPAANPLIEFQACHLHREDLGLITIDIVLAYQLGLPALSI